RGARGPRAGYEAGRRAGGGGVEEPPPAASRGGDVARAGRLYPPLAVAHPGNGRRILEVGGQFAMGVAKKSMLAGESAHPAGELRMLHQVAVPDGPMGDCSDSVDAQPPAGAQAWAVPRLLQEIGRAHV